MMENHVLVKKMHWEWRAGLLVKGLKVNPGSTKLMVGGGVVAELGAWACGVQQLRVKPLTRFSVHTV